MTVLQENSGREEHKQTPSLSQICISNVHISYYFLLDYPFYYVQILYLLLRVTFLACFINTSLLSTVTS